MLSFPKWPPKMVFLQLICSNQDPNEIHTLYMSFKSLLSKNAPYFFILALYLLKKLGHVPLADPTFTKSISHIWNRVKQSIHVE